MTPTELRKISKTKAPEKSSEFSFRLGYRPPFDWNQLLNFLGRRAIPVSRPFRMELIFGQFA